MTDCFFDATEGAAEWAIWVDNTDDVSINNIQTRATYDTADIQIDSDCDRNLVSGCTLSAGVLGILNNQPTHGTDEIHAHLKALASIESQTDPAVTLGMSDCMGTLQVNGDDDVIDFTLPAAQKGLSVTFANMLYAQVITVDAGAGDSIILNDGSTNAFGNAVDSSGAVDDKGAFVAIDGTYWMIISEQNAWVAGGAD